MGKSMSDAEITKKPFSTPSERRAMIHRFADILEDNKSFLILGHKFPDEDCLASMVATGLLIEKLNGHATLFLPGEIHEHFNYLLKICRYNSISVIRELESEEFQWDVIIICDTPKPDMIDCPEQVCLWIKSSRAFVIEIDHHTGADSSYAAPLQYALVDDASSACELIGEVALELEERNSANDASCMPVIMTRNLVLALLTGILGDSQMGKYFKSEKEKQSYKLFSEMYNDILKRETTRSSNLSTIDELFAEMKRLSGEESSCFEFFREHSANSGFIHTIILHDDQSEHVFSSYAYDTVISISRSMADSLSEESGFFGLISFYDRPDHSNFIQFRIRRSQKFKYFDLRKILEIFQITNGGGHEGAIAFRIPKNEIDDIDLFTDKIVRRLADEIENKKSIVNG
jgi:nanoRNase/pAp phosphatase (c-di-AMP/oligoRNAs hydrolase)